MKSEFKGKSTMDLILSGDRTATSRSPSAAKGVERGDIIKFYDDTRVVYVRAITDEYFLDDILENGNTDNIAESIWTKEESEKSDLGTLTDKEYDTIAARAWSYLEGWSPDRYKRLANNNYVQFQFEVIRNIQTDAIQQKLFDEGKDIMNNCKGL